MFGSMQVLFAIKANFNPKEQNKKKIQIFKKNASYYTFKHELMCNLLLRHVQTLISLCPVKHTKKSLFYRVQLKVIPFYIGDFRTHIFVLILKIIKGIERLTQRRHIQRSTSRLNSLLLYQKFTVDFKHAYLPGQLQVLCPHGWEFVPFSPNLS